MSIATSVPRGPWKVMHAIGSAEALPSYLHDLKAPGTTLKPPGDHMIRPAERGKTLTSCRTGMPRSKSGTELQR